MKYRPTEPAPASVVQYMPGQRPHGCLCPRRHALPASAQWLRGPCCAYFCQAAYAHHEAWRPDSPLSEPKKKVKCRPTAPNVTTTHHIHKHRPAIGMCWTCYTIDEVRGP